MSVQAKLVWNSMLSYAEHLLMILYISRVDTVLIRGYYGLSYIKTETIIVLSNAKHV